MSSHGLTKDDKQTLKTLLKTRNEQATTRDHSKHVPDNKPPLPTIDGEKQVAELRGSRPSRTVHRPDPETDGPYPWCAGFPSGYDEGRSSHEWKYRRLGVAREWKEPCKVCFPEGFPDE